MTIIGVVGYGVVGRAVAHGFRDKGFRVYVNEAYKTILPKNNHPKSELFDNCDFIFICVGTPPSSSGAMEDGYLLHVLNEFSDLDEAKPRVKLPIFVLKSTMIPGTTDGLEEIYPRFKLVVNPEFLRSTYAERDFLEPDRIIIGAADLEAGAEVLHLYDSWKCARCVTTPIAAELIKHLSNAFLMTKIAYACEIQRLCQHYNVDDREIVFNGITSDHRIHRSHLNPLPGKIKFNSPCLPKDLLALIKALEEDGVDTSFLQSVFDGGVQR